MCKAVRLAKKGWGKTSPNPIVGAVVVKNGVEIGCGWHESFGAAHAEINALAKAGNNAKDATLYVTLEPCSSYGKTPPCVEAIIDHRIQRVVIGSLDPNPKHNGKGVEALRSQGLHVTVGVEKKRCQLINEAFFCWIRNGRPFTLLKLATTIDGKIATATGQSQWISGPESRRKVQTLRQWADAILVGAETVRRDNPSLVVRTPKRWAKQPLRIIASLKRNLAASYRVLSDGKAKTRIVSLQSEFEWHEFFQELGKSNITSLLVEGGGEIAGNLLRHNLIDKVAFFIAPIVLGGKNSRAAIAGPDLQTLEEAKRLKDIKITRLGGDFMLIGYLTDVHRLH